MYCGVIGSRNSQPTGTPRPEDLEQEAAGEPQTGVDVAGAVQVRVVDQALPADRRARLLEVHAHHDQQIVGKPLGLGAQPFGVLARRLDVVDAAGADDHHQPVVLAVQHGVRSGAAAQQHLDALVVQRQLVEQLLRGDQRHEALDPLIADRVALVGADHGHHRSVSGLAVHRVDPLTALKELYGNSRRGLRHAARRGSCPALGSVAPPARLRRDSRGVPAERLAKSPGVIARVEGPAEGVWGEGRSCASARSLQHFASAARKRSFSASVPSVTRTNPGPPSAVPARTSTPRSCSAATTGPSSPSSATRTQRKFASLSATQRPRSRSASVTVVARRDRRDDAALDLVLVAQRLDRRRLGGARQVERLAHLVDGDPERLAAAEAVADAQARPGRRPWRRSAGSPGSGSASSSGSDAKGSPIVSENST